MAKSLPQSWLSTGPTSQSIGSLAGDGTLNINSGVLYAGSDNTSTTFTGAINQSSIGTGLTKVGNGTLTLTNSVMGTTLVNSGPQPIVFAPAASTNITGTVTGGMLVASGSVTSTLQNLAGAHERRRTALVAGGGGTGLVGNYWDTTGGTAGVPGNTVNSNFTSLALFNASVNNPTYVMSTTPTVTALSSLPNQGNSNGQYFSFSENANNNGYFPGNYNGNGPAFTQNDFEASYTGKITISASGGGTYTFGLNSDD